LADSFSALIILSTKENYYALPLAACNSDHMGEKQIPPKEDGNFWLKLTLPFSLIVSSTFLTAVGQLSRWLYVYNTEQTVMDLWILALVLLCPSPSPLCVY